MMQPHAVEVAVVAFRDARNRTLATITIVARSAGTLFLLPEKEASDRNEESVQIVEGFSYEYELDGLVDAWRIRDSAIVQPNKRHPSLGRIEPGLAVGLLPLIIEDSNRNPVARTTVEVRTSKLDYEHDYRFMLDELANSVLGLLTDIRAPSMARLRVSDNASTEVVHHQFAFLRATLDSRQFRDAIARILGRPHRRWVVQHEPVDIRRIRRPKRATIRALASGSPRVRLPGSHPLSGVMQAAGIDSPSVSRSVPHARTSETVDSPENQFVKFALIEFEGLLSSMEQRLPTIPGTADIRLRREIAQLRDQVTRVLSASLFVDVSEPRFLPLGSPVLQRRGGYREMLQTWLKFHLNAHFTWDAGRDVFEAGRRDVALLYEYWVFFQLLNTVSHLLQLDTPPASQLIEWTKDRFDLRLKSGTMLSFEGVTRATERPMRGRFSYNRTFTGTVPNTSAYPRAGSWTRTMRPDYTISLWPADISADEAEVHERIVHIHFDAKYRVDRITDLFGSDDASAIDADDRADRENTRAKRADLLKMHAYRDAIRRTEGAYVIYPGVSGSQMWRGFHEILPGLGAFALRPDAGAIGTSIIEAFLTDIIRHVADPNTSRERVRQAAAEIHGSTTGPLKRWNTSGR